MDATNAGAHGGVHGAGERVSLSAAPAPEEEPDAPVAERRELGVAGGEQPVIGVPCPLSMSPRMKASRAASSRPRIARRTACRFANFAAKRVHDRVGSLRPNPSQWQAEGDSLHTIAVATGDHDEFGFAHLGKWPPPDSGATGS
jgi:hypothetical protein